MSGTFALRIAFRDERTSQNIRSTIAELYTKSVQVPSTHPCGDHTNETKSRVERILKSASCLGRHGGCNSALETAFGQLGRELATTEDWFGSQKSRNTSNHDSENAARMVHPSASERASWHLSSAGYGRVIGTFVVGHHLNHRNRPATVAIDLQP